MLYNAQLMRYGGQNGIARAYGVLMYVSMIFHACFIGYAVGVSPVVSFHFGAQNRPELHSLLRKSLRLIGGSSIAMLAAGEALARPLGQIFVGYDEALLAMTVRAFRIYSFSFLLAGVAILGSSSFFTALNDGLTSALISFLRTLVFQIAAVLLLPLVLELDGIWLSIVFAETMAVLVTTVFLLAKRKKVRILKRSMNRCLALPLGESWRRSRLRGNSALPLLDTAMQKAAARLSQSPSVTALPEGEPRAAPYGSKMERICTDTLHKLSSVHPANG